MAHISKLALVLGIVAGVSYAVREIWHPSEVTLHFFVLLFFIGAVTEVTVRPIKEQLERIEKRLEAISKGER